MLVVLVSWHCCIKLPQTCWPRTTEIYSLTVQEAKSPELVPMAETRAGSNGWDQGWFQWLRPGRQAGFAPSVAPHEESTPCLLQLLLLSFWCRPLCLWGLRTCSPYQPSSAFLQIFETALGNLLGHWGRPPHLYTLTSHRLRRRGPGMFGGLFTDKPFFFHLRTLSLWILILGSSNGWEHTTVIWLPFRIPSV